MKKIDLHIHTKSSQSESNFIFSIEKLKEYVNKLSIDCLAITNHNLFDLEQFRLIGNNLTCKVLPGIEINLGKGHLLLISENTELEDFESKCKKVEAEIISLQDYISVSKVKEIFGDLKKYLLIPHYDKKPIISQEILEELKDYISAGEVASPKKFKYCLNDASYLVPVLFSDLRFSDSMTNFSPRQTFIDIDDVSLRGIKTSLLDKSKVFLSASRSHKFFQVFEDGQNLSTGLNVILGERSSGKTYTLKKICGTFENIKHIKQFELLETDEEGDIERFNKLLSAKQSTVSEEYLKEFKTVLEDVVKIDKESNDKEIENYIDSLLQVALEEEKKDVYAQTALFNENKFNETNNETLRGLVKSVETLIDNTEYKDIINKHLTEENLLKLIVELMLKYNEVQELNSKKLWVNSVVSNIKRELKSFTASSSIEEVNFYKVQLEKCKLSKFVEIANQVKTEKVIEKNNIRRFQIIASTKKYIGAQELLNKFGKRTVFREAFSSYQNPIDYLKALKDIDLLPETEYYKYFVDVNYKILNEHGTEVSGGERSEFNLLEKIQNAHHFDMLLIDEPESSFDNLFLKNEVNDQIKEISKSLPVVIVTHNNTVGASIKPDYILYTTKEVVDKKLIFKIYSGYPSDITLKTVNGKEINNYDIMLNCLEAGDIAYYERKKSYEILKN